MNCHTCGCEVKVITSDEGTSYFEPDHYEAIHFAEWIDSCGWYRFIISEDGRCFPSTWQTQSIEPEKLTTEELFKLYKKQQND